MATLGNEHDAKTNLLLLLLARQYPLDGLSSQNFPVSLVKNDRFIRN